MKGTVPPSNSEGTQTQLLTLGRRISPVRGGKKKIKLGQISQWSRDESRPLGADNAFFYIKKEQKKIRETV